MLVHSKKGLVKELLKNVCTKKTKLPSHIREHGRGADVLARTFNCIRLLYVAGIILEDVVLILHIWAIKHPVTYII